jgi:hypothetical protein
VALDLVRHRFRFLLLVLLVVDVSRFLRMRLRCIFIAQRQGMVIGASATCV